MKLREKMWLWGHPEGRYNEEVLAKIGLPDKSRMTPMEGCLYLGVRNVFMVPVGVDVNHRQYNKSFTTLRQVGWDVYDAATNPDAIDPYIAESADFPNIGCVVFDDFQRKDLYKQINIDDLYEVKRRLKENGPRPLDMWMVLYTHEFGLDEEKDLDFMRYIKPFDGIIMWNWREREYKTIPEKWEIFKKMTPTNRRMFGCYLFNFGEGKKATGEAVKWQLDWYLEKLLAKEAEGIVLHTNTMADLDYEAYDAALAWMAEHADDEIPD